VELRKARDISRNGFFFTTQSSRYYVGMRLYVVLGFRSDDPVSQEWLAEVAHIKKRSGGQYGISVRVLMR